MELKIGEVARRAGLSVRALRHYDAIGLLAPTGRSEGRQRLYGAADVIRLHRIQALKQLGYSLAAIRDALEGKQSPQALLQRQIEVLDRQVREARLLSGHLRRMARRLAAGGRESEQDWLDLLERMALYQQHLTAQEARRMTGGTMMAERRLVATVRRAMEEGIEPHTSRARALAWRWTRMVIARTGNDARLAGKVLSLQQSDVQAQRIVGIDAAMLRWLGRSLAHARAALFARHLEGPQAAEVLRRQLATQAHMREWPALLAELRECMNSAADPASPGVQRLAERWQRLFREGHCGEDARLEAAVRRAIRLEPDLALGVGMDAALMRYARRAIRISKEKQP